MILSIIWDASTSRFRSVRNENNSLEIGREPVNSLKVLDYVWCHPSQSRSLHPAIKDSTTINHDRTPEMVTVAARQSPSPLVECTNADAFEHPNFGYLATTISRPPSPRFELKKYSRDMSVVWTSSK
ncbi:hypothetical protein BX616_009986 [Lobosporangium transversale]|nr:hypothetical protein BX616_009986 [Lobosporangium transversale]